MAIVAGIGAGVAVSTWFNHLYDNNIWGVQDKLDYVGEKIDNAWNSSVDAVSNTVDSIKESADNVGEAIKDGVESLNPMNWGWNN